ncbi:MAG: hypothetical protein L0Y44_02365 [Phycisphaerales bacterium]|nr:hypothetical protein [Phycisphaerales bacterium]MCI0629479.1 hypothetical protein [Phycisphaerales bacterium]MCI0674751.1 hypothetical protein [Phycisphaerales bacterium]
MVTRAHSRPFAMQTPAERLENYLTNADMATIWYPPQNLEPADLVRILSLRVRESAPDELLKRMQHIVQFYDLYEAAEYLKSFLKRREVNQVDWNRSALCTATLARVGRGPDRDFARDYYRYMLQNSNSYDRLNPLLEPLEALGPDEPVDGLRDAAKRRLAALTPERDKVWASGQEARKLESLIQNDVKRIQDFNVLKGRATGLPDRAARVQTYAKIYVGLDAPGGGTTPYLCDWAELMLRREAHWPTRRPDSKAKLPVPPVEEQLQSRKLAADTLVAVLPEVDRSGIDDEWKTFHRIRCLNAIVFFGGSLTDQQNSELRSDAAQEQIHPLKPDGRPARTIEDLE